MAWHGLEVSPGTCASGQAMFVNFQVDCSALMLQTPALLVNPILLSRLLGSSPASGWATMVSLERLVDKQGNPRALARLDNVPRACVVMSTTLQ